jgi:hypothetical protein
MLPVPEFTPLKFTPTQKVQEFMAPTSKIGWIHSEADKSGASFDITVRDGLGRVRFERKNCRSETQQYGEMINEPALVGEKLSIEVSNLKGADSLNLFLN